MRALAHLLRAGRTAAWEGTWQTTKEAAARNLATRGLDEFFDNVGEKEEEVVVGAWDPSQENAIRGDETWCRQLMRACDWQGEIGKPKSCGTKASKICTNFGTCS